MPPSPVDHTTLRIALSCWLMDPHAGLTLDQQTWLRTRLTRLQPLTLRERAQIRTSLLAWAQTRMTPASWERLQNILGEGDTAAHV
jgi:hypothetical protein